MSLTRGPAIDSHPVSGVVPQYQEEQAATLPGNEFPWHGVRLQEGYCCPLSSETAFICCLSQSLHPQGSEGLEGSPQTHGPDGSNGKDSGPHLSNERRNERKSERMIHLTIGPT